MVLGALKKRFTPPPPERPDLDSVAWAQFADHVARYVFAGSYVQGKRVLDAGTGPGYGAAILKYAGAAEVVAVDIDSESIEYAKCRFGGEGVDYMTDDCEAFENARGPFDVICSFENIEHLPNPEKFMAESARMLKPDGMLIISTPERAKQPPFVNGKPANPHHMHEWYGHEFLAMLGKYYESCELRIQVKSLSLERRAHGAVALVRHLRRTNPIFWLVGVATVMLGKRYYWESIFELATPSPADYPIVSPQMASLLGSTYTNVVICTKPRQGASAGA